VESNKLLESLFDKKILLILKLFVQKKEQTFALQEVAKQCRVPIATTFRIVNKLHALELIKITRFKQWKVYGLAESDQTKYLEKLFEETHSVLDEFVETVSKLPGVSRIVEILGTDPKERKYKVSVLVIGESFPDPQAIKELVAKIKEKYNFTIMPMSLSFDLFDQQAAMGLYTGRRMSTLFEK
jgi:hypothetical protein